MLTFQLLSKGRSVTTQRQYQLIFLSPCWCWKQCPHPKIQIPLSITWILQGVVRYEMVRYDLGSWRFMVHHLGFHLHLRTYVRRCRVVSRHFRHMIVAKFRHIFLPAIWLRRPAKSSRSHCVQQLNIQHRTTTKAIHHPMPSGAVL